MEFLNKDYAEKDDKHVKCIAEKIVEDSRLKELKEAIKKLRNNKSSGKDHRINQI